MSQKQSKINSKEIAAFIKQIQSNPHVLDVFGREDLQTLVEGGFEFTTYKGQAGVYLTKKSSVANFDGLNNREQKLMNGYFNADDVVTTELILLEGDVQLTIGSNYYREPIPYGSQDAQILIAGALRTPSIAERDTIDVAPLATYAHAIRHYANECASSLICNHTWAKQARENYNKAATFMEKGMLIELATLLRQMLKEDGKNGDANLIIDEIHPSLLKEIGFSFIDRNTSAFQTPHFHARAGVAQALRCSEESPLRA